MKSFPSKLLAPDGDAAAAAAAEEQKKKDAETQKAAAAAAQSHEAIEKARLEERKKWTDQLNQKQQEIDNLNKSNTELQKQVEKIQASLDALKASSTTDGKVDIDKLVDEMTAKVEKVTSKSVSELQKQIASLQQENETMKIEKLRVSLIQEAGGEDALIAALVRGSNEQEIRDSIQTAKAAFDRAVSKFKSKKKSANGGEETGDDIEDEDDEAGSVPPVVDGNAGGSGAGGSGAGRGKDASLLKQVSNMSPEDYKKNRVAILAATLKRYPGNRNPMVR
jgi:hypothetical protein